MIQNRKQRAEYVWDFAVNGGAVSNIALGTLPLKAVVTRVMGIVETAVTSGGAATISLGNTTSNVAFLAAQAKTVFDTLGKVGGGVSATLTQALVANDQALVMAIAVATLTAGKIRWVVEFDLPSNAPVGAIG